MPSGLILSLSLVFLLVADTALAADAPRVACVKQPPTDARNVFFVSNREPLAPSPFVKLPIGAIVPQGWLRRQLELEAEGMTGHLTEISPWCKAEGNAWLSPKGEGHSPWEELPYWLKGFGDLGYVLKDDRIAKESRRWIEGVLASQREDGWFGPRRNLTTCRWQVRHLAQHAHAVNALQSFYEATGDKRVLPFLAKYFQLAGRGAREGIPRRLLAKDPGGRQPGERLLALQPHGRARGCWTWRGRSTPHTANWTAGVANWHGVNFAQGFREPGRLLAAGAASRSSSHATERDYDTVMGLYGQVPGGMFGADENCRKGYGDPRQAAETCTMVEYDALVRDAAADHRRPALGRPLRGGGVQLAPGLDDRPT